MFVCLLSKVEMDDGCVMLCCVVFCVTVVCLFWEYYILCCVCVVLCLCVFDVFDVLLLLLLLFLLFIQKLSVYKQHCSYTQSLIGINEQRVTTVLDVSYLQYHQH